MPTDPNHKRGRRLGTVAVTAALAGGALLGIAAAGSSIATGNPTPTIPSTTTPGTTTTGTIPHVTPPPVPKASQVIILPSNHKCVTRLDVKIRHPHHLKLRSLSATLDGKRHDESANASSFTLTDLPKGHFTLAVKAVTTTHRTLSASRRYHRCG